MGVVSCRQYGRIVHRLARRDPEPRQALGDDGDPLVGPGIDGGDESFGSIGQIGVDFRTESLGPIDGKSLEQSVFVERCDRNRVWR